MLNPRVLANLGKQQQQPTNIYYLSGPMTGLPDYNRPTFNKAAEWLRNQGFNVWNPAEEFDSNYIYPRKFYMRRDIEALLKCESIVMLHGWEKSAELPENLRDKCPYCGRPREYDDGHGRPRCPKQGCAGQHSGWNKVK